MLSALVKPAFNPQELVLVHRIVIVAQTNANGDKGDQGLGGVAHQ